MCFVLMYEIDVRCVSLTNFSSNTNEFLRECQGAAILENDPCRGRSRLNERERRQAALPILVFGNEMVNKSPSFNSADIPFLMLSYSFSRWNYSIHDSSKIAKMASYD